MAELRELTVLLESLQQPVSQFTGPLPPSDYPARPMVSARQHRRGRLPRAHLIRTAPPTGLARPATRLAAPQARKGTRFG